MRIGNAGLALIKQFEGFSPAPYRCPANVWTIGYGHVIAPHERETLRAVDEVAAEKLLMHDVAAAEKAVARFIHRPLTQPQYDALVCFTFNLGSGALQRSTLRQVINRGEEDAVASQWMRFVWAAGRKLPGLVRRRAAELALYQS